MRLFGLWLTTCGLLFAAWQCFAQVGPIGQVSGFPPIKPTVSGGATTTWNPSDHSAGGTLSGGNLVWTNNVGGGTYANVRSIASHSTGKYYMELTVNTINVNWLMGIGNSSASLISFIGSDNNAIGVDCLNGNIFLNGGNPSGSPVASCGASTVVSLAVDMGNTLVWWRTNAGNWNNVSGGDPTNSSTGHGISFSTMGAAPWFVIFGGQNTGDQGTANFGGSAYAQSVPSGYGNW